ncbi:hypothetical protein FOA52_011468 [Chlamydomonas sp. UWO 241]|nr:hypothetical protein FOA52_011468 [Chlamydomonas sp. UWO 241]
MFVGSLAWPGPSIPQHAVPPISKPVPLQRGTKLTGDKGVNNYLTQVDFVKVVRQVGSGDRPLSELLSFTRPHVKQNVRNVSGILALTERQLDAMYALSGCSDVANVLSAVGATARDTVEEVYGINKIQFRTWFKNRRARPPNRKGRRPRKTPLVLQTQDSEASTADDDNEEEEQGREREPSLAAVPVIKREPSEIQSLPNAAAAAAGLMQLTQQQQQQQQQQRQPGGSGVSSATCAHATLEAAAVGGGASATAAAAAFAFAAAADAGAAGHQGPPRALFSPYCSTEHNNERTGINTSGLQKLLARARSGAPPAAAPPLPGATTAAGTAAATAAAAASWPHVPPAWLPCLAMLGPHAAAAKRLVADVKAAAAARAAGAAGGAALTQAQLQTKQEQQQQRVGLRQRQLSDRASSFMSERPSWIPTAAVQSMASLAADLHRVPTMTSVDALADLAPSLLELVAPQAMGVGGGAAVLPSPAIKTVEGAAAIKTAEGAAGAVGDTPSPSPSTSTQSVQAQSEALHAQRQRLFGEQQRLHVAQQALHGEQLRLQAEHQRLLSAERMHAALTMLSDQQALNAQAQAQKQQLVAQGQVEQLQQQQALYMQQQQGLVAQGLQQQQLAAQGQHQQAMYVQQQQQLVTQAQLQHHHHHHHHQLQQQQQQGDGPTAHHATPHPPNGFALPRYGVRQKLNPGTPGPIAGQ